MATHPLSLKRVGTGKFGFEQYHGESLTENPNCPACLSNRKVTEIRSDEIVAGYDMVQDRPAFLEIKVKRYKCSLHNEFVDPYTPFGSSKLGYTSDYKGFVGAAYLSSNKSANQVKEEFGFPHISDAIKMAMENCEKMVACFTECDSLFLIQFEYGKRAPVAVFGRPTNKKLGKIVLLTICDDAQEAVELFASGQLIFPEAFPPDSQIFIDADYDLFCNVAAVAIGEAERLKNLRYQHQKESASNEILSPYPGEYLLGLLKTPVSRLLPLIEESEKLAHSKNQSQKHETTEVKQLNTKEIESFKKLLERCIRGMYRPSRTLGVEIEHILNCMDSVILDDELISALGGIKKNADYNSVMDLLDALFGNLFAPKVGLDVSYLSSFKDILKMLTCFGDDLNKQINPPKTFWAVSDNPTPAQAQKLIAKMEEMCADKIGYEVAKLRVIYQDKFHRLMCRDNSCAKHFDYLKRYGEENTFALSLYNSEQPAFFMEVGNSAAHGPLYRTMFSDAYPWREVEGYRSIYDLTKHWSYEEPPTWNESLNEAMPNFEESILPWPECPLWVDCCTVLTE